VRRKKFGSAAAARRPACPAGEIFSAGRLRVASAGSSASRDMQGRRCNNRYWRPKLVVSKAPMIRSVGDGNGG